VNEEENEARDDNGHESNREEDSDDDDDDDEEEEALSLDDLAQFIATQLWDPQSHIPSHSIADDPIASLDGIISVDEALNLDEFQVPDVLHHGRPDAVSADTLTPDRRQKIFCGFDSMQEPLERTAICITKDTSTTETGAVTYDIDSFVAEITTLAAAKRGIKCITVQKPTPSITASLHLGTFPGYLYSDDGELQQVRVPLHHFPHISLGRLVGDDSFEVILTFPYAFREEQESTLLPQRWHDIWMNGVFLAAYYEIYPAGSSQQFPASSEEARAMSTKRFTEGMRRKNYSEPRLQLLSLDLAPDRLGEFWDRVREKITLPGHHMFSDPIILVMAKGVKLRFRSSRWARMYDRFFTTLNTVLDRTYTVWAFYDWAKEFCPSQSSIIMSAFERPGETLLWNQRYLDHFFTHVRHLDLSRQHQLNVYPQYFLQGSGAASLEPAQTSLLWKHGLRYIQFYNSVKTLFVAGDFYTGSNPAMADLAVDRRILQTFEALGKAIAVDPETLMRAYLHLKWHSRVAFTDSQQKSFGLREEFRGREDLLTRVDASMRDYENMDRPSTVEDQPSMTGGAFITLQTRTFTRWAAWNLNRLCFGFESVYTISSGHIVAWEQTRMMMMFLRCIPCFLGAGVAGQHSRFWNDIYPPQKNMDVDRRPQGFGFRDNMQRYGFAWFADKIDWDTMSFQPEHAPYLGFNISYVEERYKCRRTLRNFKDHLIRVQHTRPLLTRWSDHPGRYHLLSSYLHQICARVFRTDVFNHIKRDMRGNNFAKQALEGNVPLCHDAVTTLLRRRRNHPPKLHLADRPQNRIKMWRDLWKSLWGPDNLTPRRYRSKPYRLVYRQSVQLIREVVGPTQAMQWSRDFEQHIRATCWILPYPGNGRFISLVGRRSKWWSNWHDDIAAALAPSRRNGGGRPRPRDRSLYFPDLRWKDACASGKCRPLSVRYHGGRTTRCPG
jgi:hypothetical protein